MKVGTHGITPLAMQKGMAKSILCIKIFKPTLTFFNMKINEYTYIYIIYLFIGDQRHSSEASFICTSSRKRLHFKMV
jgi:hypothetical protein